MKHNDLYISRRANFVNTIITLTILTCLFSVFACYYGIYHNAEQAKIIKEACLASVRFKDNQQVKIKGFNEKLLVLDVHCNYKETEPKIVTLDSFGRTNIINQDLLEGY